MKIEAPVATDVMEELIDFWHSVFENCNEDLRSVLGGAECEDSRDIIYLVRREHKLAATCHLTLSRSNPELGGPWGSWILPGPDMADRGQKSPNIR